jgi:hypothetical protein
VAARVAPPTTAERCELCIDGQEDQLWVGRRSCSRYRLGGCSKAGSMAPRSRRRCWCEVASCRLLLHGGKELKYADEGRQDRIWTLILKLQRDGSVHV